MPHQFKGERTLMRIFIGESDKYHSKPLYEALLEKFREKGLAGATVLRGVAGFGASSVVHTEKVLRLSLDLPLIIEVVETEEAIQSILPDLDKMIEIKVSYDSDRNRAMEDTKIWASLALPAEAKAGVDDPREMERLARSVEDVAYRRWLVSDDPDEHIEQLRPYVELGLNHLVFHSPGDGQARFLELYGSQILPRIRKEWG